MRTVQMRRMMTGLSQDAQRDTLNGCDCIISGLPWATLSIELQDKLFKAVLESLRSGGRFVTFSYIQSPMI